jgi:hypothetical protein
MSKTLSVTISDERWQQFKDAVANELIIEEEDFERAACGAMSQAIERKIKDYRHPETGLSKQMMTHYRRGQERGLAWAQGMNDSKAEFEQFGTEWAEQAGKTKQIREALLQGWLAAWERWERRNQQHGHQNENMP